MKRARLGDRDGHGCNRKLMLKFKVFCNGPDSSAVSIKLLAVPKVPNSDKGGISCTQ